ncbi:site-specific DNA-methyltransferase [Listeria rocourtiae]|uniref:DNA methyltransferase n=1 Tax=Listeria rocourtiae TaxID=647910 RepID=UPI001624A7B9|nr:DNA methyltransferase [Listeria rocourtiae]MBC1604490.1 site-specific DNA-methyltransferase [Listeria rocourtiae]
MKTENQESIYTLHDEGDNATLIANVARLYFNERDRIADVTYGKGAFWTKVPDGQYIIVGSDIKTGIDFRCLPYSDNTFHHSVIDPPYARISSLKNMVTCYGTSRFNTHQDILEMYHGGLAELKRVTKKGGYILVKCQDEVEGRRQKYTHIELMNMAVQEYDLYPKDLFIFKNRKTPKTKTPQHHARKNHSYLWVFQV